MTGSPSSPGSPRSSKKGGSATALDLARGTITLDENKTDEPRAWALNPAVVRALRAWRALREEREGRLDETSPMFTDEQGERIPETHLAARFREHLLAASQE